MDWIHSPKRLSRLVLHRHTQAWVYHSKAPQAAREEEVLEGIPAVLQTLLQLLHEVLVLPVRSVIRPGCSSLTSDILPVESSYLPSRRLSDSPTLRLVEFSFKHSKADSPTRRVGVLFFDYEYLREFEAKIGTARKLV
jgi:hypothetical protein